MIETSKTDIYRQDHTVVIARTTNDTCPVAMCETYLLKADIALDSDDFIFRSLSFFKSKGTYRLCKINKPLSYTRGSELLLEVLTQAGLEKKLNLGCIPLEVVAFQKPCIIVSPRGYLKRTGDGSLISLKMGILKKIWEIDYLFLKI